MKIAAWKKYAQIGVLAVSLAGFPLAVPGVAQQQNLPQAETRSVDVQGENDFPWGLLGLLGLIGLAGLKRRPDVVERRRVDDPIRR